MSRFGGGGFGAVLLVSMAGAGCGEVSGPEPSQITVVVVDDVVYRPVGLLNTEARPVGEAYAEVARFVDCSGGRWLEATTHVSDFCPLQDGDSNFLRAGTVLHRVAGADPKEALVVFREYDVQPSIESEWVELAPLRDGAGCAVTVSGSFCGPE